MDSARRRFDVDFILRLEFVSRAADRRNDYHSRAFGKLKQQLDAGN